MTMVRPVLRDDPFAAPSWDCCVALLALEKLRINERLSDDEQQSLRKTMEFVASLLTPPMDPPASVEADRENHRNHAILLRLPAGGWLVALARSLEHMPRQPDSSGALEEKLLADTQAMVHTLLGAVNRCRSYHQSH